MGVSAMQFRGIYAPLATPFDHRGMIYWSKFDFNLSQLLRTKVSGFVVADRWGEAPLLSSEEKVGLWKRAADVVGDRASVIATVSGCGVEEARTLCSAAAKAGCSAVLLEAPSLAPEPNNRDLFFRAVADSSELPVLAGFRPDGAHPVVPPEQAVTLSSHPAIMGLVIEGHTEAGMDEALRTCPSGFSFMTRELPAAGASLADGAGAALLAVASVVPFHALSIEEAVRTREKAATSDLVQRAQAFDRLLGTYGVPALKAALDERSFYGGPPRLPLLRAERSTAEAVSRSLYELAS